MTGEIDPVKTLCDLFLEQVECSASRVAVHFRGADSTYGQIGSRAEALGGWLQREGLKRGDRVVLLMGNSADYVCCYLGVLQAGGVVVALNPETTARELVSTLGDASPAAIVVGPKAVGPLKECTSLLAKGNGLANTRVVICQGTASNSAFPASWHVAALDDVFQSGVSLSCTKPGLDDLAQLIYTSGTTGRPKGIMLSHRNIAANCRSILDYLELTPDDSVLAVLPFFYSYGNSLLFTHLAAGGRLILSSDFVFWNRVLDLMARERATGFSGVPSSYAMLLHKSALRKRAFPHLRYMTCAGGGLAPAVVRQLQEINPRVRLFLMYGQTEATARLSTLMPHEISSKLGSIGKGIPGVLLKVLSPEGKPVAVGEIGEIVAQGDNVMQGYWNAPEETARALRPEGLWTGDLARVDEDGFIFIVGRRSDIIKFGAYRINPKEIEDVLLELDGVAEVAVVGLPDPIFGESPTAFVVPSSNGSKPAETDVLEHSRRHLPRYKRVRQVHFVGSLPRTSSGKIRRVDLRACIPPSEKSSPCESRMERER